jgi:hypothetical protein
VEERVANNCIRKRRLNMTEDDFASRVYRQASTINAHWRNKVRALVEEFPDLLESPNPKNITLDQAAVFGFHWPLHRLCSDLAIPALRSNRLKQIDTLIHVDPSCLLVRDPNGCVPLFKMLDGRTLSDPACLDLLVRMIEIQPSSVMVRNNEGYTTLHHACCTVGGDMLAVVQALLKVEPRLASIHDSEGRLPLHMVCFRQEPALVRLLMEAYPSGVSKQNCNGDLPLHRALRCIRPHPEIIKMLVKVYPEAVVVKGDCGRTPLHDALSIRGVSVDLVELLVQTNPSILVEQDGDGKLPLHHAFQYFYHQYSWKDLLCLLRLHLPFGLRDLLLTRDNKGSIPGQQHGERFVKFLEFTAIVLEKERALEESLDWISEVLEKLLFIEGVQVADIMLDWTQGRLDQYPRELDVVKQQLQGLGFIYNKRTEVLRR